MFCTQFQLCAWRNDGEHRILFMRLRCKKWSCEVCAEKNRSIWTAFLMGQLPIVSDVWYLLTLTAHSRLRSAAKSLENIRKNIDRLMKRIRRVFGKVEYVRVYEPHPTSEAVHAHMVVSGLCDWVAIGASSKHKAMAIGIIDRPYRDGIHTVQTWLKDTAQALTMGYQASVEKVDSPRNAVGYVVKYLTKAQSLINVKGLRHVQTTRRIGSPSVEAEDNWQVGYALRSVDLDAQATVVDIQTGEVIPPEYWKEFMTYPPELS